MKEFFVGLFFIIALVILAGIGVLLTPLLLLMTFALRILISAILVIFAIWLLGKCIIMVWEIIKQKNIK
jgi:hypothetical protein